MTFKRRSSLHSGSISGQATLLEVAALAGVSISTVSRIVNGTVSVSDEKREAVERAIAELNFTPNALAQSLKRGRSMTVGVVTPLVIGLSINDTMEGIDTGLSGTGYVSLIVTAHFDPREEMERCRLLLSRRVDGLIVVSSSLDTDSVCSLAQSVPVVTIGRAVAAPNVLSMTIDNESGGYLATRHLIDIGHRRIVHVTGRKDRASAADRLGGYRRALAEAGIPFDPKLIVDGSYTELSGVAAVAHLFEVGTDFTAIFAANDQSAAGVALALHRRGIRIPDDVSLVGFDDTNAARYAVPPLTTVRVPQFEIGQLAVRGLLDLIAGKNTAVAASLPQLVVRESTARCR